jgi:hypothetical protein
MTRLHGYRYNLAAVIHDDVPGRIDLVEQVVGHSLGQRRVAPAW